MISHMHRDVQQLLLPFGLTALMTASCDGRIVHTSVPGGNTEPAAADQIAEVT